MRFFGAVLLILPLHLAIFSDTAICQDIFTRTESYLPALIGQAVAFPDLNNDGFPDVANVPLNGNGPVVFMNNAGRGFIEDPRVAAGVGALNCDSLLSADVNGDGFVDLVCGDLNGNILLIRNNAGLLGLPQLIDTLPNAPQLAVIDYDADGDQDLIFSVYDRFLYLLLNDGRGNFGRKIAYKHTNTVTSFVMGDLNGDALPDAVIEDAASKVHVIYNLGRGRTALSAGFIQVLPPSSISVPNLSDIDGDGDLDVAIPDFTPPLGPSLLRFVRNDGNDNWTRIPVSAVLRTGQFTYPPRVQFTDLNGDGRQDLLVAAGQSGAGVQAQIQGTTAFQFTDFTAQWLGRSAIEAIFEIVPIDLDRDQVAEIFLKSIEGEGSLLINVRRQRLENIVLSRMPEPAIQADQERLNDVCIGDFDQDGFVDLVSPILHLTGSPARNELLFYHGTGQGTFAAPIVAYAYPRTLVNTGPASCAVGDLNGDGILDLAIASDFGQATDFSVIGLGNGTFIANPIPFPLTNSSKYSTSVKIADMDRDGQQDVVFIGEQTSSQGVASSRVLYRRGNSYQELLLPLLDNYTWTNAALGDVDGDGDLDIYAISSFQQQLLINNGTSFSIGIPAAARGATSVVFLDYNRDGILDLFTTENGTAVSNSLYQGLGAGNFVAVPFVDTLPGDASVSTDVNVDGWPDLIVGSVNNYSSFGTNLTRVYLNDTRGSFVRAGFPSVLTSGADEMRVADFDRDSYPDLLALEESAARKMHIYMNATSHVDISSRVRAGRAVNFELSSLTPGSVFHLYLSVNPLSPGVPSPYGLFRLTGAAYLGSFSVSGKLNVPLNIPNLSNLGQLSIQAVEQNGSALHLTNARSIPFE
ncbi:MAG: VCBS repeat-containing protein [Oligoflexia bacterium]|nr:VCBS repeat-containing protein [Oligoflexia bacterium]